MSLNLEEARSVARNLKVVVFDFDGVFTDNRELIGYPDGAIIKGRSHYDGQGVSLLRDIGIRVAIATNEKAENAAAANFLVNKWNGLPSTMPDAVNPWLPVHLFTGVGHVRKFEAVHEWLKSFSDDDRPHWGSCAVMGDDLVDVPLLKAAGLRAAPITAEKVVRDMADFISVRPGGAGAVRDFANFILDARGVDQTTLRPF
ncbi:MAG: hypothetical protein AAB505_01930 [Patescibacteria group bacterium]